MMLLVNLIRIFTRVTLYVSHNPYIISVFFVNIRHMSVQTQESYCHTQPVRLSIANSNFPNANTKSHTYLLTYLLVSTGHVKTLNFPYHPKFLSECSSEHQHNLVT